MTEPLPDKGSAWSRYVGGVYYEGSAGFGRLYLDVKEHHTNKDGSVHGGVIASLMDSAVGAALHNLFRDQPDVTGYSSVEMNVSFLRGARMGDRLTAEARIIKEGKTLAVADVDVLSPSGELAAKGRLTYCVFRGARESER
ncbi:MAG: PaaI family thioesterase [Dehalococcoidia bacterium]|nr:PaaI family thioesterase [Dehalococcoidia bacterium]